MHMRCEILRLHAWAHAQPALRRFTLANRLLLAMAFLPTGLVKLLGRRFTLMPIETPIGFFFEAMYRTGPYWHFIGLAQVVAAVLLLIPRTATLGALLFLPVSVSVLLITWGVGFGNTVFVAAGMLASAGWLLWWDADRLVGALVPLIARPSGGLLHGAHWLERVAWVAAGSAGMGALLATRGFVPMAAVPGLLGIGAAAFLLMLGAWTARAGRGR